MEGRFSTMYTVLLLIVIQCKAISSTCSCNDTDRVDKLEAKVQLLEHHLDALQRSMETLKVMDNTSITMQDYSPDSLNEDRRFNESAFDVSMSPVEKIAFYGRIKAQYSIVPGKGQVIVYDDEVTDSGNNYNKYTGIFTVPSNGYYVFSWSIVTHNANMFTQLVVNSNEKGSTLCDSDGSNYVTTTGVVVIYVVKDDVVFIRTHPSNNIVGDIISYGDQHSSFMGWKLF